MRRFSPVFREERVMKRTVRTAWCLLVACACAAAAAAQTRATTADLTGVVYDQSKAVLPGVTVTATNTDTNQSRSATSDAVGRFVIVSLRPGAYTVKAESSGFGARTQTVVLQLGAQVTVDFTLTAATGQTEVTGPASPPVVDTEQTPVASVITQQQINTLPINGRDFISFSVITPGVTRDNTPQQG